MGFLDSITSAFGLGSKKSGGTRDAFQQYQNYVNDISAQVEKRLSEVNQQGYNPFINQLGRPFEGIDLNTSRETLLGLRGQSRLIPQKLLATTLASTLPAQQAAVYAARQAGAGRGGLAFGGGAGAIAAQSAAMSSAQQSAGLGNALLQGEMFSLGYEADIGKALMGQDQLQLALAQSKNQAIMQQAGLAEAYRNRLDELSQLELRGRYGLASGALGGGLQGQQELAGRRYDLFGKMFGSQQAGQISNAGLGAIGIG